MVRTCFAWLALLAVACLTPRGAWSAEYRDLPIDTFGISGSTITIVVDEEILVPSLKDVPISEEMLPRLVPYWGRPEVARIEQTIRGMKDVSAGHALPYLYAATTHALSRIFRNAGLVQREPETELMRQWNLDVDFDSEPLQNLRDLIRVRPIADQRLRIEFFSRRPAFEAAAREIGLHSAEAFWDQDAKRIGVFVDASLFRWLPQKANWGGRTTEDAVQATRDYVVKLLIDHLGHELFHFVQNAVGQAARRSAFVDESAALFVQNNVSYREDIWQLANAHTNRGLPLAMPSVGDLCGLLSSSRPPLGALTMANVQRGAAALPDFDVVAEILKDDASFYDQDAATLRSVYDVGPAFVLFAIGRPRSEFRAIFGPFLEDAPVAQVRAAFGNLAQEFRDGLRRMGDVYWNRRDGRAAYLRTRELVTDCLNARNYIAAYSGAQIMVALEPATATGFVYLADTFFRTQIPFFAADYYYRAWQRGERLGFGEEPKRRVLSRRGDAYELLGDLPSAIRTFEAIDTDWRSEVWREPMQLVTYRSFLKAHLYRLAAAAGEAPSYDGLMLVNEYISLLALRGCPTPEQRLRLAALAPMRDADRETGMTAHYERLREEVERDMAIGDASARLSAVRARCR